MTIELLTETDHIHWLKTIVQNMKENQDEWTAGKLSDILEQACAIKQTTLVAFCGLFSAGKSSLLNTLCQTDTLATGAVPTTAVVATLVLPETESRVILLDTPGVDSTDIEHQEATEGALHRADIVVLVMDYQHVEASENLDLARSFSEQGKRLVLVVNQVDKHFDWELPFTTYQERVEQTFADFGIHYEQLFYTSSTSSPYSQLDDLENWLRHLAEQDSDTYWNSIEQRVRQCISDHVQAQFQIKRQSIEEGFIKYYGALPMDEDEVQRWAEQNRDERQQIEVELEQAKNQVTEQFQKIREECLRLIELAQVSPYETTERGRVYVESLRDDFKVGWFRAKEKTNAERIRRANEFIADFADRMTKFLLWPLQSALRTFLREDPKREEDWGSDVDHISFEVNMPFIEGQVKPGALVSSQYPYQYVKDVVNAIKRDVTGQFTMLLDRWYADAFSNIEDKYRASIVRRTQIDEALSVLEQWFMEKDEEKQAINDWMQMGRGK